MRELIRMILKERLIVGPDTPDWVEKFHNMSKEERVEFIQNYKSHVEKLIPKIIRLFESKFGDMLVKTKVAEKNSYYSNENLALQVPRLKFYFDFSNNENDRNWGAITKREILNDLKSFFNIDISYYGTPLDIEVYRLDWTKI